MKRQQQVLYDTDSDSVNPAKPFILDKYNNQMELKNVEGINYFNKALLELRY